MELSLRDSELRYRRLFEAAQDGILILDARTGMIEDVNPYLINMLGYSRAEFVEKKLWEVGAFQDIEASKDAFEVLQEREYIRYEDLPFRTKDGRMIEVEFVSNVYLVGDKKVIQCDIRDITEHRRIIAALHVNENKYHDLINQSPDGYFVIELSGSILTANQAMCKELEFSEEEFLSMNIWDIIPEQYLYQYRERLTKVLKGESLREATEYRVLDKTGGVHYVEVLAAPRYSGADVIGFQGIARDITARKRAEEAVIASEELMRYIVRHDPNAIAVFDRNLHYIAVSDRYLQDYEVKEQDIIGKHHYEVFPEMPEKWKEVHRRCLEGAIERNDNDSFERPDGSITYNRWECRPWHKENGEMGGIIIYTEVTTERKRAEEALRESEAKFRRLVEHLPTVIYTNAIGDASSALYVSPQIEALLGYTPQEWLADPKLWSKALHPEDRKYVLEQAALTDQSNKPFDLEYRMVARDGHLVWVHDKVILMTDLEGKPQSRQGIMLDITERKLADIAVRDVEERFRKVWEATSDAMAVSDPEGIVLATNPAYLDLYGYPTEQVIGRSFAVIFPKENREQAMEAYKAIFATEGNPPTFESAIRRMDGGERIVESKTAFLTIEGRRMAMLSTIRDITEQKRAEEALQEKQRLLSESQRVGHIGSWSYDIATDTFQYSDEMYRLLDVSVQDFQHHKAGFLSLIYPSDRPKFTSWMEAIQAGTQGKELNFRLFRQNGELRYIESQGAVIFDSSGNPVRFTGTAQDVTEHKLDEIQIRQQIQRMSALRKIDEAIISTVDLDSMMETILPQAIAQLHVDAADVLVLPPDSEMLTYVAGSGFRTQAAETPEVPVRRSLAGRAVRERRLIKVEDLQDPSRDSQLSERLAEEGFVAYYGVPLITKGRVRGVLEVFHRTPLYSYAEWVDYLHVLGGQVAIAIEKASLFANLEQINLDLSQAYDSTIEGWSRALDLRDKETEGHTLRVTELTLALARKFSFTDTQMLYIRWGGLLHDIGKMGIADYILLKPEPLNEEEGVIMRKHPQFAYDLLQPIAFLTPALDIPYCHHEKWDGTGYPRGLKGEEIPLPARIFAVTDVWDALCSDRPYRARWPEDKVRDHIRTLSGTHFDPQVVDIFMQVSQSK